MAIAPGFDIARRALIANEIALGVVANNVANANTPGFTRQLPEFAADSSSTGTDGLIAGRGVHVARLARMVDPIVVRRLIAAETLRSQDEVVGDQLEQLAGVLNDVTDPSLATSVDKFFDAADALARNPEGLAERENLLGYAAALTTELNRRANLIAEQQRAVDDRYVQLADEAQGHVERIARLNVQIVAKEANGQTASGLRDERDEAVRALAKTVGVDVSEVEGGSIRVAAKSGQVLVENGIVVNRITTRASATTGLDGAVLHEAVLERADGTILDVPGTFATGALEGLARIRDPHDPADTRTDVSLVTALGKLDQLVAGSSSGTGLIGALNAIQAAGRDLDGNATTTVPLFTGTTAATVAVAITDPRLIAAAQSTRPGDGDNATALAALRTTALAGLGGKTAAAFIASEQGRIGLTATSAADAAVASGLVASQLENEREGLSGVNLNEELTNLMRYQRAFQAAAQLVNVVNSTLDDLIALL